MEQESEKINPAEEYKLVSKEYCERMQKHITSVAAELKEVSEHMDMNDPYHADAIRSFTWGLVYEVEKEMKTIGSNYTLAVRNLRDIVVNK